MVNKIYYDVGKEYVAADWLEVMERRADNSHFEAFNSESVADGYMLVMAYNTARYKWTVHKSVDYIPLNLVKHKPVHVKAEFVITETYHQYSNYQYNFAGILLEQTNGWPNYQEHFIGWTSYATSGSSYLDVVSRYCSCLCQFPNSDTPNMLAWSSGHYADVTNDLNGTSKLISAAVEIVPYGTGARYSYRIDVEGSNKISNVRWTDENTDITKAYFLFGSGNVLATPSGHGQQLKLHRVSMR